MNNELFDNLGSTPMTRRRLLGNSAKLAGAALASSLLPPNIRRALAAAPPVGSMRDIKHVVLLMQENRSFDHYFGTMAGVRGFDDANAMMISNGKSVFHQPDKHSPDGYLLPFHLDAHTTGAQRLPSTNHTWGAQHDAWNGGKMDNWVTAHRKWDGAKGPYCMGYFTREDIPFQFALAESFTTCDHYFCSVLGPTWPNRMYWFTGTIDPDNTGGGPIIKNKFPTEGYRFTTYAERLEKAGISWRVYTEDDGEGNTRGFDRGVQFNMLTAFKPFRDAAPGSSLYERGCKITPRGTFESDAMNDRLPAVSWLATTYYESEHPDRMPAAGAAFIARKIDAIAANPEVWAKTVFILNYDENDGIFDHVAPPVPPRGTPSEFVGAVPIGAGFRVPCVIVSPWTAGGWVCSQPFDHTSVLQFLEKFTGVAEPNITDWRRKTFSDLTSAFRFGDAQAKRPTLPDTVAPLAQAAESAKLPLPAIPTKGQMPAQEQGTRKRVPEQNG